MRRLFVSFMLILLLTIPAISSGGDAVPTDLAAPKKVVVIGDSLSTGFGLATPWTEQFANSLQVELVNAAVKNQETLFGLNLIEAVLSKEKPSHVIILMGTNDAVRGSVSNALINLQKMVDIGRAHNAQVVLGTLPYIHGNPWQDNQAKMISDRVPYIKGAYVADIRARFGTDKSLYADAIHPNEAGQSAIAEVFLSLFSAP